MLLQLTLGEKHRREGQKKSTFSILFCFSSLSCCTVLLSLSKILSLIFFDCCPLEPCNKLGWTSVMILEESVPIVSARLCTSFMYSSTFRSLSLFQNEWKEKTKISCHVSGVKVFFEVNAKHLFLAKSFKFMLMFLEFLQWEITSIHYNTIIFWVTCNFWWNPLDLCLDLLELVHPDFFSQLHFSKGRSDGIKLLL